MRLVDPTPDRAGYLFWSTMQAEDDGKGGRAGLRVHTIEEILSRAADAGIQINMDKSSPRYGMCENGVERRKNTALEIKSQETKESKRERKRERRRERRRRQKLERLLSEASDEETGNNDGAASGGRGGKDPADGSSGARRKSPLSNRSLSNQESARGH